MPEPIVALRVLVVDDETVIADSLALILNKFGYNAMAAHSGEHAVVVAELEKPDVLISDVMMHGMTGIEAAIHIQHGLPMCRVILFSGQATTADLLAKARKDGHRFEILRKPIHPQNLLDRLRGMKP